jgi:hypothetical protein
MWLFENVNFFVTEVQEDGDAAAAVGGHDQNHISTPPMGGGAELQPRVF